MSRRLESFLAAMLLALTACAPFPSQPDHGPVQAPRDLTQVPDAVPRDEPRSRYGNPASYEVNGKTFALLPDCKGYHERGIASWYGTKFHGGRTSSGDTYDMYSMTAANKTLPIPCYVRVTNLQNGKSVIVKVNDRGPFVDNRLVDLSYAAATRLDMLGNGTALVDVQSVMPGETPLANDPAPPAVSVPAPTSLPTIPATPADENSPQIFLQVGAFADRANADALVHKLTAAGLMQAFILSTADPTRTLYKVRIGPLADVDKVDQLYGRLAELGFHDVQVVIP
jgi:rare lipoprotein A